MLARAQLCGMFAAGYSAKVTEKDQQGISAFEDFTERDLFAIGGGQGEGGGGGVWFHKDEKVISDQLSVGGQMACCVCACLLMYVFTCVCFYAHRSGVEG